MRVRIGNMESNSSLLQGTLHNRMHIRRHPFLIYTTRAEQRCQKHKCLMNTSACCSLKHLHSPLLWMVLLSLMSMERKASRCVHWCGENPKWTEHMRKWGEAGTAALKSNTTDIKECCLPSANVHAAWEEMEENLELSLY